MPVEGRRISVSVSVRGTAARGWYRLRRCASSPPFPYQGSSSVAVGTLSYVKGVDDNATKARHRRGTPSFNGNPSNMCVFLLCGERHPTLRCAGHPDPVDLQRFPLRGPWHPQYVLLHLICVAVRVIDASALSLSLLLWCEGCRWWTREAEETLAGGCSRASGWLLPADTDADALVSPSRCCQATRPTLALAVIVHLDFNLDPGPGCACAACNEALKPSPPFARPSPTS